MDETAVSNQTSLVVAGAVALAAIGLTLAGAYTAKLVTRKIRLKKAVAAINSDESLEKHFIDGHTAQKEEMDQE